MIPFALNVFWQLPLLAAAAWLFLRLARFSAAAEHRVWLGVLLSGLVLPGLVARHPLSPAIVESTSPTTHRLVHAQSMDVHSPTALIAPPQNTVAESVKSHHWAMPPIVVSNRFRRTLGLLYALVTSLGALRIARSTQAVRRLLKDSQPLVMNRAEAALWQEVTSAMKLPLSCVSPRLSQGICSPAVVGVFRPALLLPPAFRLCLEAEQRAALCHELAHIRRGDCFVHAICQVIALPLFWHPAAHAVLRHIAQTREMACDAMAARAMHSGPAYARSLLSLARTMMGESNSLSAAPALGLFRSNKLEERIMRLTEAAFTEQKSLSLRGWAMRALGSAGLASAIALAGIVHVAPVSAQTAQPDVLLTPAPVPQTASPTSPASQTAGASAHSEPHKQSSAAAPGTHSHVIVRDGGHLHRWTGANGEPYVVIDDQAADLTPEQKLGAEAEYLKKYPGTLDQQFSSPEFKALVDEFSGPQFKAQVDKFSSPEFKAQIEQLTDSLSRQTLVDPEKLQAPEFKLKLDAALLKAQTLPDLEMEKRMADATKRMDEASRRLEEATRRLDRAQRLLDEKQK